MKRALSLGLLTLLLASCGGSSSTAVTCASQYWDGSIGTCLPSGWKVLDRATLLNQGLPNEVLVGFRADEPASGQTVTILVTREPLSKQTDTSSYSDTSIQAMKGLPGYQQVDLRKATIDGIPSQIHIFSTQTKENEPRRRYYQLSAVGGNTGYTLTVATPLSVSATLENQILLIFNNLSFIEKK